MLCACNAVLANPIAVFLLRLIVRSYISTLASTLASSCSEQVTDHELRLDAVLGDQGAMVDEQASGGPLGHADLGGDRGECAALGARERPSRAWR